MIISVIKKGEVLSSAISSRERLVFLLEQAQLFAGDQPALAIELCDEAQTLAMQEGDNIVLARIRSLTGICYCTLGEYDLAFDYFQNALNLYEHDDIVRDDYQNMYGLVPTYRGLNAHISALDCFIRGFEAGEHDAVRMTAVLTDLGCTLFDRSDYTAALEHFSLALTLCTESGERESRGTLFLLIGRVHACLGHYEVALESYNRSMAIRLEYDDNAGLAAVFSTFGVLYAEMGNLPAALDYFSRSVALYEQVHAGEIIAVLLVTMGSLYEKLGRGYYEQALDYYGRGLSMSEKNGQKTLYTNALQGLAEANLSLGYYAQALEQSLAVLSFRESANDRSGLMAAHSAVGRCFTALGQLEQASKHLEQALSLALVLRARTQATHLYHQLAAISRLSGNFHKALEYTEQCHMARQEIYGLEYDTRITGMAMLRSIEKTWNEAELYRLKTERMAGEIDVQNRGLLNMTLNLVHQYEFLHSLRTVLRRIAEPVMLPVALPERRDTKQQSEAGWTMFERRFCLLHGDFLARLRREYPALSAPEVKVCSLLKFGLSSRDSAQILRISVQCLDTYCHSIRRKLRLDATSSLSTFFSSF